MAGSDGLAVVIPGEAPETDDEDDISEVSSLPSQYRPQTVAQTKGKSATPVYDSLLHKCLRDNVISLNRQVEDFVVRQFCSLKKELNGVATSVQSTQSTLQDVSCKMHEVTEILYKVDANLDVILQCQLEPNSLELSRFPGLTKWSQKN